MPEVFISETQLIKYSPLIQQETINFIIYLRIVQFMNFDQCYSLNGQALKASVFRSRLADVRNPQLVTVNCSSARVNDLHQPGPM